MIQLTIDGKTVEVQQGTTVIEAGLANGIDIPHICYHPELSVTGACRLCLVEVEGSAHAVPGCGLAAQNGMVIHTQSENLYRLRHNILEMLVANHPLDCMTCDKAGSCALQKYAYEYGVGRPHFAYDLPRTLYQKDNPFFVRDHQFCIMCGKCVRVCDEVVGASAITITGRGFHSHIATPFDGPMIDSSCVFCGSCVQVCPTAALMPVSRLDKGREWELERKQTVCGYCGVGCTVEYAMIDGEVVYAQGAPGDTVNGEMLCTKGRYGWDFATHKERLTSPMLRRDLAHQLGLIDEAWELPQQSVLADRKPDINKSHVPVDWDTALDLVGERLAAVVKESGSDAVMGLTSARCTNEENYVFQKFMRAAIGTNNLDHCARL